MCQAGLPAHQLPLTGLCRGRRTVCLELANVLSAEALFDTCIIPFICFFGAFAFLFYPLRDVLHPTGADSNKWQ